MADRPLRVVIAGAGIAGLEAALAVHELAGDRVDLTLISQFGNVHQQGLPADAWSLGPLARIPVSSVARAAGARLVPGRLTSVDAERRFARLHDRSTIAYDALVVAVGARRVMSFDRGAVIYGGRLDAEAVERVLDRARRGAAARFLVVVPPGAGWTLPAHELAARAAEAAPASGPRVTLVTYEAVPAEALGPTAAGAVAGVLADAGVRVLSHCTAEGVARGELCLTDGGRLAFDSLVALPYLRGPRIEGLPCTPEGYLPADPHGRVAERVFAAGDAIDFPVKQGGLAAQQAAAVAESIGHLAGTVASPTPVQPVLRAVLPVRERCLHLEHDLTRGTSSVTESSPEHPVHRVAGVRLQAVLDRLAGASATV
jgi:sulfide:quinone oxidoreductase